MYGSTEIHTKDANQSRRLLAVSSVMTGKVICKDIALEVGVGLQTLLHDEEGPSGRRNRPVQGCPPFLDRGQLSTLKGCLKQVRRKVGQDGHCQGRDDAFRLNMAPPDMVPSTG